MLSEPKPNTLTLTITDPEQARLVKVLLRELGLRETAPGNYETQAGGGEGKPDERPGARGSSREGQG